MAGKYTYFISDTHLGAAYLSNPLDSERRVVRWLDSIKHSAKSIYLLGDIIDYWFEYRNVVPRGYVRFFGKLAELADSGIAITWITGNHDIWIFDYLPSELGIRVIDGPIIEEIDGHRFLLDHGDKVGKQPLPYRIMSGIFHNRICQRRHTPAPYAAFRHRLVEKQPREPQTHQHRLRHRTRPKDCARLLARTFGSAPRYRFLHLRTPAHSH